MVIKDVDLERLCMDMTLAKMQWMLVMSFLAQSGIPIAEFQQAIGAQLKQMEHEVVAGVAQTKELYNVVSLYL